MLPQFNASTRLRIDLVLRVWVPGTPKGQPRARPFVTGGRKGSKPQARVFTPGTAEAWKSNIAAALGDHLPADPITAPCRLQIDAIFPRPKRLMRRKDPAGVLLHAAAPDWDNVGKPVADVLEQLGILKNDAQVAEGRVRKWYTAKTSEHGCVVPGAAIQLWTLTEE